MKVLEYTLNKGFLALFTFSTVKHRIVLHLIAEHNDHIIILGNYLPKFLVYFILFR